MGFLKNLLAKNDYSDLKKEGGMENKYDILIKKLYSLSKEKIVDLQKMEFVELNYMCNSKLMKINEYFFEIIYVRPDHIMKDVDTFTLKDKNNSLLILFERSSESLLPIDLGMPKKVQFKFEFKNTSNQEKIFHELIENIQKEFGEKYNFSDSSYAKLIENN